MPRPLREDVPGRLYHVTNRGVARRSIFESRREVRFFLSRLARAVRRGWLEVHAYCILPNHFHLLVRSLEGHLSGALQWVQDLHARRFNRARGRGGPVFTGRFHSSEIDSTAYLVNAIRYIELNPVRARLASRVGDYPFASAAQVRSGRIPPWLDLGSMRWLLGERRVDAESRWAGYFRFVVADQSEFATRFVERRLARPISDARGIESLIHATSPEVQRWLRDRSELADGRGAACGILVVSPGTVLAIMGVHANQPSPPSTRGGADPRRLPLAAGLLRWVAGLSTPEVAGKLGVSHTTIYRWLRRHTDLLKGDPTYAELAALRLVDCLRADYPGIERYPPFAGFQAWV